MIFNLFAKIFLIEENLVKNAAPSNIIKEKSISNKIDYSRTVNEIVNDFYKYTKEYKVDPSYNFFYGSTNDFFNKWILYYLLFLNIRPTEELFKQIYLYYKEFADNFKEMMKIDYPTISSITKSDIDNLNKRYLDLYNKYGDNKIDDIEVFKSIPAEFMVNIIGSNKVADEKFNRFRIFDIMLVYQRLRFYLFTSNIKPDDQIIKTLDRENEFRFDDLLLKYPEVEDELKHLFIKYGFDKWVFLFDKDLRKYQKANTVMGYQSASIVKYNKYLAKYIESIGYKPMLSDSLNEEITYNA